MNTTEILKTGAAGLGVELTTGQLAAFEAYMAELVKWNSKMNLTAIREPSEIAVKHFLDSLALAPLMPDGPFTAADIGAGAGFPGLPLRIVRPDMRLVLVEPARKKATFLRHIIRLLGLSGAEVAGQKAEPFSEKHAGGFDVALSRAFREPVGLLALVGPLLKPGGRVVLSLGPDAVTPDVTGWHTGTVREITLPHSDFNRRLTVLVKGRR